MRDLRLATATTDTVEFVAAGVDWLTVIMPRAEWERRGCPVDIEVSIES